MNPDNPESTPQWIDIGINLTNKSFKKDLEQVVEAAYEVGVQQMIITGTSEASSVSALSMANQLEQFSTAGIHPHDAKSANDETWTVLRDLYQQPRVVAVGEAGLDFNRDFSPRPVQEKVFQQQLELAVATQLPLFLHQRDAHERFLPIIKEYRDSISDLVVHCFTGSKQELFDYLDLDIYIGITGWICDERRGKPLLDIVHNIPLNRLMLETDGPYLLPRDIKPKPKSGRNEPKFLPHIGNAVARCYQQPVNELAEQVLTNTKQFFRLDNITT